MPFFMKPPWERGVAGAAAAGMNLMVGDRRGGRIRTPRAEPSYVEVAYLGIFIGSETLTTKSANSLYSACDVWHQYQSRTALG